jgi:hypothetical protein
MRILFLVDSSDINELLCGLSALKEQPMYKGKNIHNMDNVNALISRLHRMEDEIDTQEMRS